MKTSVLIGALFISVPVCAQAVQKPGTTEIDSNQPLLDHLKKAVQAGAPDDSLPPEAVSHLILNKPKIAHETAQRLEGLREAGNPHIRRGLMLGALQEDPERTKVDLKKLREQRIRMIEQRGVSGPPVEIAAATAAAQAYRVDKANAAKRQEPSPKEEAKSRGISWLLITCAATGLIVWLLWRKR